MAQGISIFSSSMVWDNITQVMADDNNVEEQLLFNLMSLSEFYLPYTTRHYTNYMMLQDRKSLHQS